VTKCAYRGGRVLDDEAARAVDVAARAQVHDGVGPGLQGGVQLAQFVLGCAALRGAADVGVHLDPQALADGDGSEAGVLAVGRQHDQALFYPATQRLLVDAFGGANGAHVVGDGALAGAFELCHCWWPPGGGRPLSASSCSMSRLRPGRQTVAEGTGVLPAIISPGRRK